jgi:hypothetical protein
MGSALALLNLLPMVVSGWFDRRQLIVIAIIAGKIAYRINASAANPFCSRMPVDCCSQRQVRLSVLRRFASREIDLPGSRHRSLVARSRSRRMVGCYGPNCTGMFRNAAHHLDLIRAGTKLVHLPTRHQAGRRCTDSQAARTRNLFPTIERWATVVGTIHTRRENAQGDVSRSWLPSA